MMDRLGGGDFISSLSAPKQAFPPTVSVCHRGDGHQHAASTAV